MVLLKMDVSSNGKDRIEEENKEKDEIKRLFKCKGTGMRYYDINKHLMIIGYGPCNGNGKN